MNPRRYFLKISQTFNGVRPDVYEHKDGMFIDYDDYRKLKRLYLSLKAEFKSASDMNRINTSMWQQDCQSLREENEELRLTNECMKRMIERRDRSIIKMDAQIKRLQNDKDKVQFVSLEEIQNAVDKMPPACPHTEHPLMPCIDCIGKMMRNEK